MAKKTSSATKKKPASKKPTVSKKRSTKKTTTKKRPSKKTTSKPSTKKVAPSKKTTKKTAAKPATKKTSSKKSPSKAKTAAPPSPKTAATNKKTGPASSSKPKPTPTKTTSKKTPSKKTTKKTTKSGTTAKSAPKKTSTTKTPANPARFRGVFSGSANAAGKNAAAELLKSAGLTGTERTHAAAASSEQYERLTKSPYNKRQLEKFRMILREKRAQLMGDVENMETEALRRGESGALSHLPQHMADAGSDTYDQSLNLNLAAGQRRLMTEIEDAIRRIDAGTFGICERLGKPIGEERLQYTPWARYSIEGAREMERLGISHDRPAPYQAENAE